MYTCNSLSTMKREPWSLQTNIDKPRLKVLTNEKRGGLAVVPFDRSRFKLFSRKFSNKLFPNNAIVSGFDTLFTSYNYLKQRYCTSSPIFQMTVRIGPPS